MCVCEECGVCEVGVNVKPQKSLNLDYMSVPGGMVGSSAAAAAAQLCTVHQRMWKCGGGTTQYKHKPYEHERRKYANEETAALCSW